MKKHKKMNWHIFSYRHTGDDMVIFTDGNRWIAYDAIGWIAVNDLSDMALRIMYAHIKSDLCSFDLLFDTANVSLSIPCGYGFGFQFDRCFLEHLTMICEGV